MLLLNGAVKALLVLLIVTVFFNSVGCWFHTLRYRYSVAEFTSFEYLLFFQMRCCDPVIAKLVKLMNTLWMYLISVHFVNRQHIYETARNLIDINI